MNIKIVAAPLSEAPENVRKAWIGCTFKTCGRIRAGLRRGGVLVSREYALSVLAKRDKDAAKWWIDNPLTHLTYGFEFEPASYRILRKRKTPLARKR